MKQGGGVEVVGQTEKWIRVEIRARETKKEREGQCERDPCDR